MHKLTTWEEREVLATLNKDNRIDEGSSRIVFDCSPIVVQNLGLNPNINYVIKLAVGHGGLSQNEHELKMYEKIANQDHIAECFAKIYAYGRFILIMESVDVLDYRDLAQFVYEDCDIEEAIDEYISEMCYDDEDISPELMLELRDAAETIAVLTDLYGNTADNGQLGRNAQGRLVAYDYGFFADEGCGSQCSFDLIGNLWSDQLFNRYVYELLGVLKEIYDLEIQLNEINDKIFEIEQNINRDCR